MNTTHDDNATTWRELADQLTPEQVRRFDRQEAASMKMLQRQPAPQGWVPDSAEDIARGSSARPAGKPSRTSTTR